MFPSCSRSLESNSDFDVEYFPGTIEIKMLTKNEWNNPDSEQPEWLGYNYENKAFKLEEKEITGEHLMKNEDLDREDEDTIMSLHEMHYPGLLDDRFKEMQVDIVTNPYLKRAFQLKKSQSGSQIMIAFHATEPDNVNSIIENNFNWRFSGRNTGFLYGKGVYFSEQAVYTHQFCKGPEIRIILSLVQYKRSCVGSKGNILPISGCDTAMSPDGHVLVKFEDSEFLPMLIFNYNSYCGF